MQRNRAEGSLLSPNSTGVSVGAVTS